MHKYLSFWRLFLTTKDVNESKKILNKFISENEQIQLRGDVNYFVYYKDKTINAEFCCSHAAATWQDTVFDVISIAQNSASGLILSGCLSDEVDIFSNDVYGSQGGVRSLHVMLTRIKGERKNKFNFYEIVQIVSADLELSEINSKEGAIVGMAQNDDGSWGYAVSVADECWCISENDLVSLNRYAKEEDLYPEESIRTPITPDHSKNKV